MIFKITFDDEVYDNKTEVLEHNMKQADNALHLNMIIFLSTLWLEQNKDKNYYDLERYFRDNKFNTHLLANKNTELKENQKIDMIHYRNPNITYNYDIQYLCYNHEKARETVEKVWENYPTGTANAYKLNLEALRKTGVIVDENVDLSKLDVNFDFDNIEKEHMEILKLCNKKATVTKVPNIDIIQIVMSQLKSKLPDETVKIAMIGSTKEGDEIYGFTKDDKTLLNDFIFSINIHDAKNIKRNE